MRLLVTPAIIAAFLLPLTSTVLKANPSEFSVSNNITSSVKAPLASQSLLLDITKAGSDKLVAVGQYGHILLSTDGNTWQQADVPLQSTLTNVYFLDERLGWAVGHDATILHSSDGGEHWQIQQYLPELESPLLDIYFRNEKDGIAIGAYGRFFRTQDGGSTWESEFHPEFLSPDDAEYIHDLKNEDEEAYLDEIAFILPHFNRLSQAENSLFLVGERGLLAKSDDFGIKWQPLDNFYQGSFYDFEQTATGDDFVVGLRGHVFKSPSESQNWLTVETQTTALLNDIVEADNNRLFILGNNGVLLESHNGGNSFKQHVQSDGKALIAGVWFKGKLIVVSDVGIKQLMLSTH